MTRPEEIFPHETPKLERDSTSHNGMDVYYIIYGYERSRLSHLFPIYIVDGKNRRFDKFRSDMADFISGVKVDNDLCIRSPGDIDTSIKCGSVEIRVDFQPISQQSAWDIENNICDELKGQDQVKNLFEKSIDGGNITYSRFRFGYEGWNYVDLPYFTNSISTKGSNLPEELETTIPCYVASVDWGSEHDYVDSSVMYVPVE